MMTNLLSALGLRRQSNTKLVSDHSENIEVVPHPALRSTAAAEIVPKIFVEMELDVVGWYAIGHYPPQDFITAITQREPHHNLTEQQVEQVWARIDNQRGEYFDTPVNGAQPITLLILWD